MLLVWEWYEVSQQSSPKRSQDQHSESPVEHGFFSWTFVALIVNRFSVVINVSSWENTVFFTGFENGGIYFFATKEGSQSSPHPHVGHSVTDSVPGWKILWHSPPRRGKWWGFENGAYIYTLKNVARVLLVSYYLLVFHYVFFCHLLKFVEPAGLYNCIMGHRLSWSLTMSTVLWFQRNSINFYWKFTYDWILSNCTLEIKLLIMHWNSTLLHWFNIGNTAVS